MKLEIIHAQAFGYSLELAILARPRSMHAATRVKVGTFRGWVERKVPTFKFLGKRWPCVDIGGGVSGATLQRRRWQAGIATFKGKILS